MRVLRDASIERYGYREVRVLRDAGIQLDFRWISDVFGSDAWVIGNGFRSVKVIFSKTTPLRVVDKTNLNQSTLKCLIRPYFFEIRYPYD